MPHTTPRFTEAEMTAALELSGGFLYMAARRLGTSSRTVLRYLKRYPALRTLVDQRKGERVDTIEGVLWNKAMAGEPWAVIFFLKTQGKDRGYTERHEIAREFKEMSDAELLDFIKARTATLSSSPSDSGTTPPPDRDPTLH